MKYLIPTELETDRLQLRMFVEDDWEALCEMFRDEECVRYTTRKPLPDWETWRRIAMYLGHWQMRGYGPYAVVEKASDKMIGPIGLWYPGDWPEPEIKWSLARAFWGKGFACEAASAVKTMVGEMLGWQRLISLIDPENERSKSVARRLGAVHEKTVPFRGGEAEIFLYRLPNSELM